MAGSRFWRVSAALVVGAVLSGIPSVTAAAASEVGGAPPGVNVCVFYGICAGPALPGR